MRLTVVDCTIVVLIVALVAAMVWWERHLDTYTPDNCMRSHIDRTPQCSCFDDIPILTYENKYVCDEKLSEARESKP